MTYALLPGLAESLGLSFAQVGMLRAANRSSTALLQIPAGLLAERTGARNLLVIGTCIAGAALFVLGLWAFEFWQILLGFVLLGAGGAVQHPLSSALITGAFRGPSRRRALGTYNAFGDIGKFAFMGATILALGVGLTWQTPVIGFGVVALVVAAVIYALLPRVDHKSEHDVRSEECAGSALNESDADPPRERSVVERGWGLRSVPGVVMLCLVASLDSATRIVFLTFVAFAMIEKGVASGWAASAVLVTVFGGMCGKYACGLLAERFGVIRTIAVTEVLTAVGIVAVLVLPHYLAFALLPFLGVVLSGTSSVIYGTVGE
ncbi:MAG: MFS transporter, partial [Chromatiales bacterium]|nr:MFS transporter [Chromatiales bacterium]